MGLPAAEDHDGKVIVEALGPEVLEPIEGRVVQTYGSHKPPDVAELLTQGGVHAGNQQAIERLKALGYVGD